MFAPRTRVRRTAVSAAALVTLVMPVAAACGTPGTAAGRPASSPGSGSRLHGSPVSVPPLRAPVPGPVPAAKTQCTGWPASAPSGRLPRSFVPGSVLRCVTATVAVPGKGTWLAATLEKADSGLEPLAGALSAASGHMEPGHMCPQFMVAPPQIVMVSRDGTMVRPRFPVTGCGQIQPQVLAALNALRWQTASRHLLEKVPG